MLLFASPKSPWGQSVASAEGGNRLMKLLGMRGATPGQEDSLQPAHSLQVSAAGVAQLIPTDSAGREGAGGEVESRKVRENVCGSSEHFKTGLGDVILGAPSQ